MKKKTVIIAVVLSVCAAFLTHHLIGCASREQKLNRLEGKLESSTEQLYGSRSEALRQVTPSTSVTQPEPYTYYFKVPTLGDDFSGSHDLRVAARRRSDSGVAVYDGKIGLNCVITGNGGLSAELLNVTEDEIWVIAKPEGRGRICRRSAGDGDLDNEAGRKGSCTAFEAYGCQRAGHWIHCHS